MLNDFPYRARAMFAFEEQDGVDVCFFGMHVQVIVGLVLVLVDLVASVGGDHGGHVGDHPAGVRLGVPGAEHQEGVRGLPRLRPLLQAQALQDGRLPRDPPR